MVKKSSLAKCQCRLVIEKKNHLVVPVKRRIKKIRRSNFSNLEHGIIKSNENKLTTATNPIALSCK